MVSKEDRIRLRELYSALEIKPPWSKGQSFKTMDWTFIMLSVNSMKELLDSIDELESKNVQLQS
jgi:hypothetical protein